MYQDTKVLFPLTRYCVVDERAYFYVKSARVCRKEWLSQLTREPLNEVDSFTVPHVHSHQAILGEESFTPWLKTIACIIPSVGINQRKNILDLRKFSWFVTLKIGLGGLETYERG